MPVRPPLHRPRPAPRAGPAAPGAAAPAVHRAPETARASPHARGYDAAWRRVRAAHLDAEPLCRFCLAAGRVVEATVVDHIRTVEDRPDLRLTDSNLRSLCPPCHNRRTAQDQARERKMRRDRWKV